MIMTKEIKKATVKRGSDGDYTCENTLLQDDFIYIAEKIVEILNSKTNG